MNKIITLTLNPVLDKSTTVAGIKPDVKLRCTSPVYEPGGGGINVSRAIKKLGGTSLCMYMAGGPPGTHLENLLMEEGIDQKVVPIAGWTRDNLSVMDTTTNKQYRFGVPGPIVSADEWTECLEQVKKYVSKGDYLVASGKLPLGMPNDFYVKVSAIAKEKKARFVLDTSGDALLPSSKADIFLFKPNLAELSTVMNVESISALELNTMAQKFLQDSTCEIMVVSLGPKGALLVVEDGLEYVPAPTVHQISSIGAGDSMVAGMVLSLLKGKSYSEMVKYGVACGAAATITPSTELCKKEDVDRLYGWMMLNESKIYK